MKDVVSFEAVWKMKEGCARGDGQGKYSCLSLLTVQYEIHFGAFFFSSDREYQIRKTECAVDPSKKHKVQQAQPLFTGGLLQ